jgi:uracil-DNA glycosylase
MTEMHKETSQILLDEVKTRIDRDLVCPLKDAALNMVFGKGNPQADILFIGEAPGAKEDEVGLPFVGAAGKQLDRLLGQINLTIDDVYIANILKYRPPKNRDPTTEEIANHTPYLIEQIKIIQPKIIATLGNYSTKFVLSNFSVEGMKKIEGISKLHGKPQIITVDKESFTVIPLYHPAAMMYRPKLREVIDEDFQNMIPILTSDSAWSNYKPEKREF